MEDIPHETRCCSSSLVTLRHSKWNGKKNLTSEMAKLQIMAWYLSWGKKIKIRLNEVTSNSKWSPGSQQQMDKSWPGVINGTYEQAGYSPQNSIGWRYGVPLPELGEIQQGIGRYRYTGSEEVKISWGWRVGRGSGRITKNCFDWEGNRIFINFRV